MAASEIDTSAWNEYVLHDRMLMPCYRMPHAARKAIR